MRKKPLPAWARPVKCPFCSFQNVVRINPFFEGKGKRIRASSKPPTTKQKMHTCSSCHQEFPLPAA